MPEGAIYVGRPTKWQNPYKVVKMNGWRVLNTESGYYSRVFTTKMAATVQAVSDYKNMLERKHREYLTEWVAPLRGKDLACWCPLGELCHADVLLELANQEG